MAKKEKASFSVPVKAHVQAGTGHLILHVDDAEAVKKLTSGALHECELTFNETTTTVSDGGDKPPHP